MQQALLLSSRLDAITSRMTVHEHATFLPLRQWLLKNPGSTSVSELLDKLLLRAETKTVIEKDKNSEILISVEGDIKKAFESFETDDFDTATILVSYLANKRVTWSSPSMPWPKPSKEESEEDEE